MSTTSELSAALDLLADDELDAMIRRAWTVSVVSWSDYRRAIDRLDAAAVMLRAAAVGADEYYYMLQGARRARRDAAS